MASAQLVQNKRVEVMVDNELDAKDNVVSIDNRGRGISGREVITDDKKLARVTSGVQPSSIYYEGCFDRDAPRWRRVKESRAADSQQ